MVQSALISEIANASNAFTMLGGFICFGWLMSSRSSLFVRAFLLDLVQRNCRGLLLDEEGLLRDYGTPVVPALPEPGEVPVDLTGSGGR